MTTLFWLAVVASIFGGVLVAYVIGFICGEAETRDEYLRAMDRLREDYDRRMRGA